MKVWYITFEGEMKDKSSGVGKKITGQVKALNQSGVLTEIKIFPNKSKIHKAMPFHTSSYWDKSIDIPGDITGLYIRYPKADFQMIRFLQRTKQNNPEIKIVIEIPTYPYEKEKYNCIIKARDRFYRRQLHKYVDRIAILGEYEEIFHIPAIKIKNGIDMEEVMIRQYAYGGDDMVHFCFVAMFSKWHGADRFIQGMIDYYTSGGEVPVQLHLIGEGPETPRLKQLSQNEKLKNKVFFEGKLNGKSLDGFYNKCDMAISSLGLHRLGLFMGSVLKSREYLAKGIPFCYAGKIDVFEENPVDFAFQIPGDETPVDIAGLLAFYDQLKSGEDMKILTARIRKYGEAYVDVISLMKPVADYFLS